MIRWPDDETGRNSVSPCTIPMTIAWPSVSMAQPGPMPRRAGLTLSSRARSAPRSARRSDRLRVRLSYADEERGEDQRDRRQELHEDVERRAGGVLERIADRVADDGRGVGIRALAEDVAVVVLEVARLDVLLGVVPRAAAVVEDGREHDAGDRPDHQHAGDGLGAEQEPDDDRRGDRDEARGDHLAQGGLGRDVDDAGVVRALACNP